MKAETIPPGSQILEFIQPYLVHITDTEDWPPLVCKI